jgi:hypothetical protein
MSQTVASTLVEALEKIGVTHIFGLISDSLNPIGDVVRRSKIEWVGVRHEEGAAAVNTWISDLRTTFALGVDAPTMTRLGGMMKSVVHKQVIEQVGGRWTGAAS